MSPTAGATQPLNFRNDAVDAGEIGAGHNATALYAVTFRRTPMAA